MAAALLNRFARVTLAQLEERLFRELLAKRPNHLRRRPGRGWTYCEPLEMRVVLSADTGLLSQLTGTVLGDVSPVLNVAGSVTGLPLSSVVNPLVHSTATNTGANPQSGSGQAGSVPSSGGFLGSRLDLGGLVNEIIPVNALLSVNASLSPGGLLGSSGTAGSGLLSTSTPLTAQVLSGMQNPFTPGAPTSPALSGANGLVQSPVSGEGASNSLLSRNSLQISYEPLFHQTSGSSLPPTTAGLAVNLATQRDSSLARAVMDEEADRRDVAPPLFEGSGNATNAPAPDEGLDESDAVAVAVENASPVERFDAAEKIAMAKEQTRRLGAVRRNAAEAQFDYRYGHERRAGRPAGTIDRDTEDASPQGHSWLLTALALLAAGTMGAVNRFSATDRAFSSHEFWNELAGRHPHQN